MSKARQFFSDLARTVKVYPWTLAKLVKVLGGGTVQEYLDGTKKVNKAVNADNVTWSGVTNKPSTYPPSSHTHSASQINGLPSSLPANGGNADTVDGFGFNNRSANGTPNYVPGWAGGTPTNMDMFSPKNWSVNNANLLAGAKLYCQTLVINLAEQSTKIISYPSDRKTMISVMAVNSNCEANYSYVQSYAMKSDGLHLRFNEANGNNLQVNIWWYYIPK